MPPLSAQGKAIVGLVLALLLTLIVFASREVQHFKNESLLATSLTKQTQASLKNELARSSAQEQVLRLTSERSTLERQLATSKSETKSYSKKWNADGSGELRVDSQVSSRLDQSEKRVEELTSLLATSKQVEGFLQQAVDERTDRIVELQHQVDIMTLDTSKQGKRVAVLVDVDTTSPATNVRAQVLGFIGPLTAGVSVVPLDLTGQPLRVQAGWMF